MYGSSKSLPFLILFWLSYLDFQPHLFVEHVWEFKVSPLFDSVSVKLFGYPTPFASRICMGVHDWVSSKSLLFWLGFGKVIWVSNSICWSCCLPTPPHRYALCSPEVISNSWRIRPVIFPCHQRSIGIRASRRIGGQDLLALRHKGAYNISIIPRRGYLSWHS